MPKSLQSLDDHVSDLLASRERSRAGRFQPVVAGVERVADVVGTSCAAVAAAFEPEGFRWSRSALRFSRKVGAFTHLVTFQADAANSSGAHVAVSVHAQVKNSELAKWREVNGISDSAYVWASQIGYLPPRHEYLKWQLVDPATRGAEAESMVQTVRELVIPAFEVCRTKEGLSAGLMGRREITWTPDWAIDIALWCGNKEAAAAMLRARLASPDGAKAQFLTYLKNATPAKLLHRPDHRIDRLAWSAHRNGLWVPGSV